MAHPSKDLEALRRLLLEPEQQALQALQDPARWEEWVAQVLPRALLRRRLSDNALQHALNPILEEALVRMVQRNPRLLVDILFPVLLPAIRRAVANLFASLTQSLNQTLDQVFSVQGLRWRIEALSTGKSFAEVVLSHTLLYRVEQVLLIERSSGLLLAHRVAEGISVQDGTLVSAMLTAISDFVRDSFDPEAGLNAVNFGERVLVVEQGAQAVLAAVVRGTPPQALQERLQDTLGEIQMRFADEFRRYDGNNIAFVEAAHLLDSLLESAYRRPKIGSRRPYALLLVLSLLMLGLAGWGYGNFQASRAWSAYLERLYTTPGLVVTATPRRYEVRGLKDPLAPDPLALLEGLPLRAERIRASWQPYQSLEPEIVLKRIQQQMDTPATVRLDWRNGVLVVSGRSTTAWLSRLRNLAPCWGWRSSIPASLRSSKHAFPLALLATPTVDCTHYGAILTVDTSRAVSGGCQVIQKKICMLGAFGVGKTSLVTRYVHGIFSEKYQTTVGVKIDKKVVKVEGREVSLVLWDLYGEDQFQRVQPFYLRSSSGYLLVADGTRADTLEAAQSLQARAQEVLGPVPFILLLNKRDLPWQVDETQVDQLWARGWEIHYTSAKTGEAVEEAFNSLAGRILRQT